MLESVFQFRRSPKNRLSDSCSLYCYVTDAKRTLPGNRAGWASGRAEPELLSVPRPVVRRMSRIEIGIFHLYNAASDAMHAP